MLELVDIRRQFGSVVALDGLALTVPPGQMHGFVGRNGAGKTTAMRIALGAASTRLGAGAVAGSPRHRR